MTPDSERALATYEAVLRPRPARAWAVVVCLVALAAIAAGVRATERAFDLAGVKEFHAFELGLERRCLEENMTYTRGECSAPDVTFEVVPFEARPELPPGSPNGLEPLAPKKNRPETRL